MRAYSKTSKRLKSLSDWPLILTTFAVSLACWGIAYSVSIGFPLMKEGALYTSLWETVSLLFNNIILSYATGFVLTLFLAFLMQRIADLESLIKYRTRLPFVLFFLFLSTNIELLPFTETSVALLFLAFALYELFKSYRNPEMLGSTFKTAALLGFSSLFFPHILWFVPFLWIGMYKMYTLTLKNIAASLIGLFTIYWIVLGWCVWQNDFTIFVSLYAVLADFDFFHPGIFFQYYQIGFAGLLIFFLISILHIKRKSLTESVRIRQKISFLPDLSIGSLTLMFIYSQRAAAFMAIFYLPTSIAIAYLLSNLQHRSRFIVYYSILILLFASFSIRLWNYL